MFYKQRINPRFKKGNGHHQRIDGDPKHWDLVKCLEEYYVDDSTHPCRVNPAFLIALRNKIEHRHRELDPSLYAAYQAALMNFEEMLTAKFGKKYAERPH